VAKQASKLESAGISHVWLPPAYKDANGKNGSGYAVYDLFDLGEFDQKGTVSTKYGTKEEYLCAIDSLQQHNIQVLADVVLNHKQGADEKEKIRVRRSNPENRNEFIADPEEAELYTRYTFPNRGKQYSDFVWDAQTFTGIDEQRGDEYRIYKILNDYGSEWDEVIEEELGNFDYLMGADIELRNPHVRDELKKWGKWFSHLTKIDGFRLDAVKHMSPEFVKDWIDYMRSEMKRDFFCMAEYWSPTAEILQTYVDKLEGRTQLLDVPLHNNFHEVGKSASFDLRNLFKETLLERRPELAITFVDNHDTQPMQTLESPVADWFKPHAYAVALLRLEGTPCVFYPDFYGVSYVVETLTVKLTRVRKLRKMLKARQLLAYGEQKDAFVEEQLIGWTRTGIPEKEFSGLAVVLNVSNKKKRIELELGDLHRSKKFVELTGNLKDSIETDNQGKASFPAKAGKVAIWIREEAKQWF
jgi:alpha-amylase